MYKTLIGPKPLCIMFDKVNGFIRVYGGTNIWYYLVVKDMVLFLIGLDIL